MSPPTADVGYNEEKMLFIKGPKREIVEAGTEKLRKGGLAGEDGGANSKKEGSQLNRHRVWFWAWL